MCACMCVVSVCMEVYVFVHVCVFAVLKPYTTKETDSLYIAYLPLKPVQVNI